MITDAMRASGPVHPAERGSDGRCREPESRALPQRMRAIWVPNDVSPPHFSAIVPGMEVDKTRLPSASALRLR
jgi:hypothetical protein